MDAFKKLLVRITLEHQDDEIIRPGTIAAIAVKRLDKDQLKQAALLYLCQIERGILRRSYENPDAKTRNQPPLPHLPLVQERYPQRSKGRGYVKLVFMLIKDWHDNLWRLRKRSQKEAAHADQLEQWGTQHYGLKSKGKDYERV